jgi:hypothetical protein
MRTKALLLTAALGVAGIASSMAQTVYSVNIVGYINKTLPNGLSLIANQLNHTPDNRVETVIGIPNGTVRVSKFNPAAGNFQLAVYDTDAGGWSNPDNITLNPGQGAYVDNVTGAPLPLTFVGEVQLTSSLSIHKGLDIYSSVLPQGGDLNQLQFPIPGAGLTRLLKFTGTSFTEYQFDSDVGAWNPAVPTLAIADAFWVDNATADALTWARSFPVGP